MPQFSRWTNPSLPQTLQMGMFLLYIDAVFGLLGLRGPIGLLGLVLVVGSALGRPAASPTSTSGAGSSGWPCPRSPSSRWCSSWLDDPAEIFDISLLIYAIFPVAQFALLVHPQSRQYQKVVVPLTTA